MAGRADTTINLQKALSASSAMPPPPEGYSGGHHPATCPGELALHEDGSFACEHTLVGADDIRTRFCIDHSIALLVIELARDL